MQLHKSLDRLYDRIMIDMQVVKIEGGDQVMGFTISEDFLPFTEGLYKATEEVINEQQVSPDTKKYEKAVEPYVKEYSKMESTNTLTLSKK